MNYVEFPAEGHGLGQLHTYTQQGNVLPERFAWLSEAGIFHGHLDLSRKAIPATELEYLPRRGLLPFPALENSQGPEPPIAMVHAPMLLMLLRACEVQCCHNPFDNHLYGACLSSWHCKAIWC